MARAIGPFSAGPGALFEARGNLAMIGALTHIAFTRATVCHEPASASRGLCKSFRQVAPRCGPRCGYADEPANSNPEAHRPARAHSSCGAGIVSRQVSAAQTAFACRQVQAC